MLSPVKKTVVAATGGIIAAVGSAICCAGPLVAIALGVSGAGLAATFDPLRPYFAGAALLSLGVGFALLRREESRACEPGQLCASPVARRRLKVLLWVATVIAIPFLSFPWWSPFIFG